jgi:DNA-binding protein HU-beta
MTVFNSLFLKQFTFFDKDVIIDLVMKMNKNDIVNYINAQSGKSKKDINMIIDAFLLQIAQALQNDEKITLTNFGTFTKRITQPINIYSPYDGKLIKNVRQTRISFRSSPRLIRFVNSNQDNIK